MPTDAPDQANVVALPPVIVAAALALGALLHVLWPVGFLPRPAALWLGGLLVAASVPLVADAIRQLIGARTVLDVRKPTTEIVTAGVFAISRNPIYLAMMLAFLGIAALVNSLWILLLAVPLFIVLQKGVIEREERYLERKFGDKYLRYKAGVRRWI